MIKDIIFTESKDIWDRIYEDQKLRGPFFQYDWHRVWYETLGSDYAPLPLLVDDKVIIPLAEKDGQVIFSGGDEVTDYNDAIGNEDLKSNAWIECFNYLKSKGFKRVNLNNIPEGKTVKFLRAYGASVEKEDTTPLFEVSSSWDEYEMSLKRKYRKELRRKIKNFERDNNGVAFERDGSIECLISLMKNNPDKVEFFSRVGYEDYFRKIYDAFPEQAKIRCLTVHNKLVASIYYFETEESFLLYNSGFDPNYDSAGFYIKAMNIKRAIEKQISIYNFLQGDERYKYELGGKDNFVYRAEVGIK